MAQKTPPKAVRAAMKYFDGSPHKALSGHIDRYNGIRIDDKTIAPSTTVPEFKTLLDSTMQVYKQQGFRGVWLRLKKEQVHLAGVAVQEAGFNFHHAKNDYLMLTHWIPESLNKMPGFATHYVGVGGLVLNSDRTKMLCI